jgi:hypothetical protein
MTFEMSTGKHVGFHVKCKFDVCGSVQLGNICFIQVQLDVLYSLFLDNLAVHVSGAICTHHQEHNSSVQP